jgi:AbrB family looped-hinge helix DNA binding protein
MSIVVKVQHKGQLTLPTGLRSQAGISEGDLIEAAFEGGRIVLTPKVLIDRSKPATTDDEYTPAQRRMIDARLARSTEEIKQGRTYGPFESHEDLIKFLHDQAKKTRGKKTAKSKHR